MDLHTHPGMEKRYKIPKGHVIVDEHELNMTLKELDALRVLQDSILNLGLSANTLGLQYSNLYPEQDKEHIAKHKYED